MTLENEFRSNVGCSPDDPPKYKRKLVQRTVTRDCVSCHKPFTFVAVTIRATKCIPCRKAVKARGARLLKISKRVGPWQPRLGVCQCGAQFTRTHPRNTLCSKCAPLNPETRLNGRVQMRDENGMVTVPCARCGNLFTYKHVTFCRSLCTPCQPLRELENDKRRRKDMKKCRAAARGFITSPVLRRPNG
jgi:hypothetical protein